jgi:hypothetical protein
VMGINMYMVSWIATKKGQKSFGSRFDNPFLDFSISYYRKIWSSIKLLYSYL